MKNQIKNLNKFSIDKFIQYELHIGSLKLFWNPFLMGYMTGSRNNFCILDLYASHRNLRQAFKFLLKLVVSGKKILFVGNPVGLERVFSALCKRYGHYHMDIYVDGFFTNYIEDGKKTLSMRLLEDRPSLVFFLNVSKYDKARQDVLKHNIPILAFVNTNDSLFGIDYPIPANINSWKGGIYIYNLLYYLLSIKREDIKK